MRLGNVWPVLTAGMANCSSVTGRVTTTFRHVRIPVEVEVHRVREMIWEVKLLVIKVMNRTDV